MIKLGWFRQIGQTALVITLIFIGLCGCVGSIWTGATLIYDRHNVYKKWDDYRLSFKVSHAIGVGKQFKHSNCVINSAVFHGDVLLAGHVPNRAMYEELEKRITSITGYRRLFLQIGIRTDGSHSLQDSWITTKIRSRIFADGSIDPNAFKVVTSDKMVYLMGDVPPDQAKKVINIARQTQGVVRVVTLLKYYTYQRTL